MIGFIGLGIMGKPMAKNLLKKGYSLMVCDICPQVVNELTEAGARAASDTRELAKSCEIILTMLPNSPQVKEVALGPDGIAENAPSGTVLIDMSSISPIASREIAAALAEKGIQMLDAPVSGGEPKAVDGTLSFMVGGSLPLFEAHRDLLGCMGASVVRCGEIGAGNVTKLCNQVIVAVNIAAVSEAFMLGQKAGVLPEAIFQAIRGGLAGSTVMNAKVPMMLERNFTPGFKIDLHIKDLNNALETARETDSPMFLTCQVMEMMKMLHHDGKGQCDHSALVQFYERIANEILHP